MVQERKATVIEKIRGWFYQFASYPIIFVLSATISYIVYSCKLMDTIIQNSSALAVTGAAIAAFLFTIQSVLISVPKDNPFMRQIRRNGKYLIYLHRFCLVAEVIFMIILLPMLYMSDDRPALNIAVLALFIGSLIYTIWSMYLMCRILIDCEKYSQ